MQKDFNSKTDILENRIEDKIDNNNNLNKLMQLDFKVSTELAQFRTEAKADIMDSLDTIRQRMRVEQTEALGNISESFQRSLNKTFDLLHPTEMDVDILKTYDQTNRDIVKNQTDMIREMLTSGEVNAKCIVNDTSDSNKAPPCHRYLDAYRSTPYPHYIKTVDGVLKGEILCDTKTDDGGWIVIQRRTGSDVDFYRDWADYKNGFGDTSGDFWLGNDAIHKLTVRNPYELRIDMRVKQQDKFAHYTSFKIEAESDNYRLRLGSYSGSIGERPGSGLSYHNNQQFSTRDRDNDDNPNSCAVQYRGAWWYKRCYNSNLNGVWGLQDTKGVRWNTGVSPAYPTFVEMKIRKL
ncbi:hypothetical protein RRG08_006441 [Elysia crispata]|uniref:Fibrinogen C-terminal domain-containing protein n=1 Tax=Elysia crispata TaxID=231223 RepID=A0AAE1D767_9GAST|nr:hypothetical protein RRG08_006441 [Elysia crispata]